MSKIADMLEKHEGYRSFAYRCTSGKLTIGIGRNLDDRGVTRAEALYLLEQDIEDFTKQLRNRLFWFDSIHPEAQLVLIDMCFNMGLNGLLTFTQTLEHIKNENYKEASRTMLQSKWATQVGVRALELSDMLFNI